MVKALRSWIWISAIVLVSRRMWAEDLSPVIGARTLRIDSNRRGVPSLLWVVILLLAGTAAYGQISLPAPGDIDTVAGYGPAAYSGDNGAATAADLNGPHGVAVDAAGNIYIADMWNNRIREITASTGIITTVAGNGTPGYSGDGGSATSAELYHPSGVAVDTADNIYIADGSNNRIRKVTASTGDISTVAGNGSQGYSGDGGPATSTALSSPYDVAVDASGNIYISDEDNYRVRKVTVSTGDISTVAGTGTGGYTGNGGPATSAEISQPMQLVLDTAGNIYFVDWGNVVIRKVTASTGDISTVAGNGSEGYSGDGGLATAAQFYDPYGVAVDAAGNIYIADSMNNRIRKVTVSTGDISTVAGNGTAGYSGDGGTATSAELEYPYGVSVDTANNIYIADDGNNRIRAVVQAKATPSISVACSPNPITYGSETTTCTATVGDGATGSITWTINGGAWTSGTLSAGTTSAEGLSGWNAGTYTIGAVYGGDSNNNPVSSSATLTIGTATPTVSVVCSPNPLTYGGANSICTISASDSGSVTGTVSLTYNGAAWTTLSLTSGSASATWSSTFGIGTYTIGATYNGDGNNTTAAGSGAVTVNKASPTVSLSSSVNPLTYGGLSVFTATINGGQSPSGTVTFQVNGQTFGTATVSGGVAIYNGANEMWTAGTDAISAIYSGDADNSGATGTLTETINKATPAISWPEPATITFGTPLGATQLNASSTAAETFVYTPAAGTVLTAGSYTLSVALTPTDSTDYNTATATVILTVNKATPTITWATPAAITFGTALSATQLNASSTTAGTFVYTPSAGTVLGAGSQTLSVAFTPTDMTDYNTATATVTLTVNKATPTITWAGPAAITYGTALSTTQLDASSQRSGHLRLLTGLRRCPDGRVTYAFCDLYPYGQHRLQQRHSDDVAHRQQGHAQHHLGDTGGNHLWHRPEFHSARCLFDRSGRLCIYSGLGRRLDRRIANTLGDLNPQRHDRLQQRYSDGAAHRQQGHAQHYLGDTGGNHLRHSPEFHSARCLFDRSRRLCIYSGLGDRSYGWIANALGDLNPHGHDRLQHLYRHGHNYGRQSDADHHLGNARAHHLRHGAQRNAAQRLIHDGGHLCIYTVLWHSADGRITDPVGDLESYGHDGLQHGNCHCHSDGEQGHAHHHLGDPRAHHLRYGA